MEANKTRPFLSKKDIVKLAGTDFDEHGVVNFGWISNVLNHNSRGFRIILIYKLSVARKVQTIDGTACSPMCTNTRVACLEVVFAFQLVIGHRSRQHTTTLGAQYGPSTGDVAGPSTPEERWQSKSHTGTNTTLTRSSPLTRRKYTLIPSAPGPVLNVSVPCYLGSDCSQRRIIVSGTNGFRCSSPTSIKTINGVDGTENFCSDSCLQAYCLHHVRSKSNGKYTEEAKGVFKEQGQTWAKHDLERESGTGLWVESSANCMMAAVESATLA